MYYKVSDTDIDSIIIALKSAMLTARSEDQQALSKLLGIFYTEETMKVKKPSFSPRLPNGTEELNFLKYGFNGK